MRWNCLQKRNTKLGLHKNKKKIKKKPLSFYCLLNNIKILFFNHNTIVQNPWLFFLNPYRRCPLLFIKSFQSCDKSLINLAFTGQYWENIGPRSFLYGPRYARSVLPRPRVDIFLYILLDNKSLIRLCCHFLERK